MIEIVKALSLSRVASLKSMCSLEVHWHLYWIGFTSLVFIHHFIFSEIIQCQIHQIKALDKELFY